MAGQDAEGLDLLWESAIAEYKKDAKHDLSPDTLRAIRSPEELLVHIEASGQSFKDFRNRHSKLWNTLRKFVAPLTASLKIAVTPSSVADASGGPASAVVGACLHLVKSCENVSEAYDWIEQVITELQRFSERLALYMRTQIDGVLKTKIVTILAFALRIIGRSECLIREKRFRQYLRVTFLGKDEKTKFLVDEMNRQFGSEQQYVVAATYAETVDGMTQLKEGIKQIQSSVKESQEGETGVQIDDRIRRLLCNTSAAEQVEETFARNKRNLLKGTGAWLQHEALFGSWLDRRATILWIFGGPGAGKSYLSTWIVKQLLYELPVQQGTDGSVAYFFVNENNGDLRDANNILKTLAWQLVEQDSQFKEHVAVVSKRRTLTITAEDTWENIFLEYYGNPKFNPKFASIVIDGLDEATSLTRRTLLGFMKDLVSVSSSLSRPAIQFAVVGRTSLRDDVEITRTEKIYFIEVSKHKNKEDIDSYIRKRLEEVEVLREMRKMKNGLKRANKTGAAIKAKILDGADGVFLWAKLLIDTIVHKDLAQIEAILKEPPGDLDDMIWSVFDRLAKDEEIDHEVLRKMFLFCAYTRRPLKFGELDLFLSLPHQKPNFLLWKQTRGKLSSVFQLKFPIYYDPDEDDNVEVERDVDHKTLDGENIGSRKEEQIDPAIEGIETDAVGFDFSGDGEDDGEDDFDDDLDKDGIFNSITDHRLQSKSWGLELESKDYLIRHLSDNQLKTMVTFCHARIRDYIVQEGDSQTRRKPPCVIIPDSNNVHVELTINCLEVLRLGLSLKDDSRYLTDYPLRYAVVHLEKVHRDRISDEDFFRIVDGLHWIFGTDEGAKCFIKANQEYDDFHSSRDDFYQTWVGSEHHLRMVQDWFREAKDRSVPTPYLDIAARSWVDAAALNIDILLRPLMIAASKLWLTKPGYDSRDYTDKGEFFCWLLHGWLSRVEIGFVPQEIQEFEFSRSSHAFYLLSAERLETLANWAGLEQNTHWHTCLGWMLMNGYFYVEAITHYEKAIVEQPYAWVALEGLARSYGEQEEYQLAIDWQKKAIAAIPESMKWIAGYLYPHITTWSLQLGDEELALEAARNGFDAEPFSLIAQLKYLEALDMRGRSDDIMSTIEWLDDQIAEDTDYSWLVRFLAAPRDAYREIGKACRECGQPAWVLEVMDETLTKVDQDDRPPSVKIWLAFQMARFKYAWYDDREDEFIKLAEVFLERLGRQTSQLQEYYGEERTWTIHKLAQLYFDKAVGLFHSAQKVTNDLSVYEAKLKTLAVSVKTSSAEGYDGFDFFSRDYPSMLWGRWMRDYKKADEKVWRQCFKVRLLEEMNTLDDDDPTNDMTGMASLAVSLLHAGDRTNAAAILAVLFKPLEDTMITKEFDNEEEEEEDHDGEVVVGDKQAGDDSETNSESGWEEVQAHDHEVIASSSTDPSNGAPAEQVGSEIPKRPAHAGRGLSLNVTGWAGGYTCDNCYRKTLEVAEMYFCEVCWGVHWCDTCLAKVRDRSIEPPLREHRCNPSHDFYRAWPIADEAKGIAAEYFEGGVELRREWLENLRGEWLGAA